MAFVPVGAAGLDLKVIAAGLHRGELPGGPPFEPLVNELELSRSELADYDAFAASGWRFLALADLDWRAVQQQTGERLEPGLLARSASGGLVVLRDLLVVSFTTEQAAQAHLERYSRIRKLTGEGLMYEVQIRLPERDLLGAILSEVDFLRSEGAEGAVGFAEPSLLYRVVRPGYLSKSDPAPQWHWTAIHLEEAWARIPKVGQGCRVAVIDLGFHLDDPQYEHAIAWTAHLEAGGEVDTSAIPADNHGTVCAGLIAAANDMSSVNGAAPGCELILVSMPKEGVISQIGLAEAIRLCVAGSDHQRGADVISCSLAYDELFWPLSQGLQEAIDHAHTHGRPRAEGNRGVSIVWSASNRFEEIRPGSVHAYRPLIVVAQSNEENVKVASSFGCGLDLLAPGDAIVGRFWNELGSGSAKAYGSSVATPCVAGVVALILSNWPKLTWQQVTKVLIDSCDPEVSEKEWDNEIGWGYLNAMRAVEIAGAL